MCLLSAGFLLAATLTATPLPANPATPPARSSPGSSVGAPAGPYDHQADASRDLAAAAARASASGRRVLALVGGNWCGWCRALERLLTTDEAVRVELARSYEVVHVNYSKENRNEDVMKRLDRPDQLGFPALVVLSPSLEVVVRQETGSLEKSDKSVGHDSRRVQEFLTKWAPSRSGSR